MYVSYTGAKDGTNEYISAIITDKPITEAGAKITYYGRIAEASAEDDESVRCMKSMPMKRKFRESYHGKVMNRRTDRKESYCICWQMKMRSHQKV